MQPSCMRQLVNVNVGMIWISERETNVHVFVLLVNYVI